MRKESWMFPKSIPRKAIYLSMIWDLRDNSTMVYKVKSRQTGSLVLDIIRLVMKN